MAVSAPITVFPQEVCDMIIDYLPMSDILRYQRVSRRWKDWIESTPFIQRKLFRAGNVVPLGTNLRCIDRFQCDLKGKGLWVHSACTVHPLLFTLHREYLGETSPAGGVELNYIASRSLHGNHLHLSPSWSHVQRRLGTTAIQQAPWKGYFVTNPPLSHIAMTIWYRHSCPTGSVFLVPLELQNENGVTLGDLFSSFWKRILRDHWRQWCQPTLHPDWVYSEGGTAPEGWLDDFWGYEGMMMDPTFGSRCAEVAGASSKEDGGGSVEGEGSVDLDGIGTMFI